MDSPGVWGEEVLGDAQGVCDVWGGDVADFHLAFGFDFDYAASTLGFFEVDGGKFVAEAFAKLTDGEGVLGVHALLTDGPPELVAELVKAGLVGGLDGDVDAYGLALEAVELEPVEDWTTDTDLVNAYAVSVEGHELFLGEHGEANGVEFLVFVPGVYTVAFAWEDDAGVVTVTSYVYADYYRIVLGYVEVVAYALLGPMKWDKGHFVVEGRFTSNADSEDI